MQCLTVTVTADEFQGKQ